MACLWTHATLLLAVLCCTPLFAARGKQLRTALVIGNSNYAFALPSTCPSPR
jgi:hypothetical protein